MKLSKLLIFFKNPVLYQNNEANVAQLVEHFHGKEKVIGSIPIIGSRWVLNWLNPIWQFAKVAQLVEHLTRNEKVAGSIPAFGSVNNVGIAQLVRAEDS